MAVGIIMTVCLKGIQFRNWGFMVRQTYVKAFTKKDDGSWAGGVNTDTPWAENSRRKSLRVYIGQPRFPDTVTSWEIIADYSTT